MEIAENASVAEPSKEARSFANQLRKCDCSRGANCHRIHLSFRPQVADLIANLTKPTGSGLMNSFLKRWLITTIGVLIAARIVPGITYETPGWLVLASLLLGVFNAVLRPILTILTLPIVVLTLGFFMLIINAVLLDLVGNVLQPHFQVAGFGAAFWGSLVISIVTFFANRLVRDDKQPPPPSAPKAPPRGPDLGSGPVIDV